MPRRLACRAQLQAAAFALLAFRVPLLDELWNQGVVPRNATPLLLMLATGAIDPVVKGALLKDGVHVDLIGGFNHAMREADDDVVRRASVFVDTYDDAAIAGDIAQPLESGLLTADDLLADLAELVGGAHPGRTSDDQVTMFKSAGTALEDVAAARLALG